MHKTLVRKQYFEEVNQYFLLNDHGKDQLINFTVESFRKLVLEEKVLFLRRLSEETIKFRFAINLKSILYNNALKNPYHPFLLDLNYNRTRDELKFIDGRNRVLFDMVIHQRGAKNNYPENLVHFELKGFDSATREIDADRQRLISTTYMNKNPEIVKDGYRLNNGRHVVCGYQLGFLIILRNNKIEIETYSNSHLERVIEIPY